MVNGLGVLEFLWYLVAGIIAAIPLYFLLDGLLPTPDGAIALALITVLGYVIHQVFRWATFNHYFSERQFNEFFRQWLSQRVRLTLSKRIEKVDGEIIDAIYTQLFYSSPIFEKRFEYVNRKSTFSTSVGVARFAFLIGFVFSILCGNNILSILYFILFVIFWNHYQNLDRSINLHEKALVLLNKENVDIDEKNLEELLDEFDKEKRSESCIAKGFKALRCIIFGV